MHPAHTGPTAPSANTPPTLRHTSRQPRALCLRPFPAPEPRIAPHTHFLLCSSLLCFPGFPDFPAVRPAPRAGPPGPGKAAVILLCECVIRTRHKHDGGLRGPVLPRPGHDGAGKEAGSASCFWKLQNSSFPSSHPRRSQRGLCLIPPSSLPLTPGRFSRPCRGGSSSTRGAASFTSCRQGKWPGARGPGRPTDHRQDNKKKRIRLLAFHQNLRKFKSMLIT